MSYIRHLSSEDGLKWGLVVQSMPVKTQAAVAPSLPSSGAPVEPTPAVAGEASVPGAASPSFSPLYQQIKSLILRSLQAGEWRPGEAIPSEIELAARFKVSQGTVRKAVDELASENLLLRRQGKGT